jgi:hypothetical protein
MKNLSRIDIVFHDVMIISCASLHSYKYVFPVFPIIVFETGFNYDFGNVSCKKLTSARKQMFMLRAPKVLVIQLKVIDPQLFLILYLDKTCA